ncbi:hypothetical protein MZM54_00475 [[Brevibacterium] frigoritolerans]|nr:hypothetical protein [Peribacillus frigoritolerans]
MEFTLTVGQEIYGQPGFNNRNVQGLEEDGLLKGEVTKVGTKFIYVKFNGTTYKYKKKDLREVTNYMPDYVLILDREANAKQQELSSNIAEIKKYLPQGNETIKISLDKTIKILEILRSEN